MTRSTWMIVIESTKYWNINIKEKRLFLKVIVWNAIDISFK